LSVAWILATALYFLSLMLASLAIDRPRVSPGRTTAT
jgi:hypothetical protein